MFAPVKLSVKSLVPYVVSITRLVLPLNVHVVPVLSSRLLGNGVGVAVGVLVGVIVGVLVGVSVGVLVGVFVGVFVGVLVGV